MGGKAFTEDVQRSGWIGLGVSEDAIETRSEGTYANWPIMLPAGLYLHTTILEAWPKIVPGRQLAMAHATCLLPFQTT